MKFNRSFELNVEISVEFYSVFQCTSQLNREVNILTRAIELRPCVVTVCRLQAREVLELADPGPDGRVLGPNHPESWRCSVVLLFDESETSANFFYVYK